MKYVGSSSIYPIYQRNVDLVENRLCAHADESTLLAVVSKPADGPTLAASLDMGLARIKEWCSHWYMTLNPNKTKALVISRPRTVNPPLGDLVLSVVSIRASPNLVIGVKFDRKLTFEDHELGIVCQFCLILSNWLVKQSQGRPLCFLDDILHFSPNLRVLFSGVGVSC